MKYTFIVVDDAPFIRELISNFMRSQGHICVGEADDGRRALSLVTKTLPDIVFLDLVLPVKNGVQVAREMRDLWPQAKIVAVSSLIEGDTSSIFERTLFDHQLAKPFTKAQLLECLKGLSHPQAEEIA